MQTKPCHSCGKPVPNGTNICPFCGFVLGITLDDNITVVNEKEKSNKQTDTLKFDNNGLSYNHEDDCQPINKQRPRSLNDRQPQPIGNNLSKSFRIDEESPGYIPVAVPFNNNNSVSRFPKKKKNRNAIWVFFTILFTALAFILFGLYINKQKDKEVEAERQKTKQVQMKMEKLQKDTEQVKQQTDSLIAAGETKRLEDSIKAAQTRKAEKMAREQAAREEAVLMAMPKSLDGSHYLKGTVKSKKGDKYWFKLWLEIEDGDVSGSFKTSANEGPVNGHVDSSGNMVVYELDYDYDETGYYWSGKFNGKSYSGNYYNDWESESLTFWTN